MGGIRYSISWVRVFVDIQNGRDCRWRCVTFPFPNPAKFPHRRGSCFRGANLPEARRVLARFAEVPGNLAKADRTKLAHAIRTTVASVTIGVRDAKVGEIAFREFLGELRFHEGFGIRPITIPDEAIGHRHIWRQYAELVRNADHPLHLKEFAAHINTPDMFHPAYHVRRAEKAGLIRKVGGYGGWVAVE